MPREVRQIPEPVSAMEYPPEINAGDPGIVVTVRWLDGYMEKFECREVRAGGSFLWMRLLSGSDRMLPTGSIRWFSRTPESHEESP
jgi:hypothetical protein